SRRGGAWQTSLSAQGAQLLFGGIGPRAAHRAPAGAGGLILGGVGAFTAAQEYVEEVRSCGSRIKWPSSRGRVRPGSDGRAERGLPKTEPGLRPSTSTTTWLTSLRFGSPLEAAG